MMVKTEDALFGWDPTPHLVAIEPHSDSSVRLFLRDGDIVRQETRPFSPWMLLAEAPQEGWFGARVTRLEGDGYAWLTEFAGVDSFHAALAAAREQRIDVLTYPSLMKLALLRNGLTLFKQMAFEDIVRLQFDIETNGLSPDPAENRVLLIAVSDNRGLLEVIEGDEPDILRRFVTLIRERDPDVFEGHNVYGFDLPFLITRAQRCGVPLNLGRDESPPRIGAPRNYAIAAGGNSRPFSPVYVYGRHVLDTYLIVQRFDWAHGVLTGYGLKEAARAFGISEADRVELPRDQMQELLQNDPDLVRLYARQDVVETRRLADLITPVEFYQTQMVPDSYHGVAVTGNGEKINSLMVRSYLAAGRAVPRRTESRPFSGGYTEVRRVGVLDRVVKADVESLYPSLMLTHDIAPRTDTLGIFLPLLAELKARRIEAKRMASSSVKASHTAQAGKSHRYWDGLQGSFKVLINSFYGYLGGPFHFNDYSAAERVTEEGRRLVQDLAERMERAGAKVIEIDTDGIYFVPPEPVADAVAEEAFVDEAGAHLPNGIRLAFDGRYRTMVSIKTKNYVLVDYEGKKTFKGASLRSRADERFGRQFMERALDLLLAHDLAGIGALYAQMISDIFEHRLPILDLVRRTRITEKTLSSAMRRRTSAVAQGVDIGDFILVYEKADGTLALMEDYAQDENTRLYMDKLYRFAKRLEDAVGPDFDRIIPKPRASGLPNSVQLGLDF